MCLFDFFFRYEYKYVCRNFGMVGGKDNYLEVNGMLDVLLIGVILFVYSSCSEVEGNLEFVLVFEL